MGSRYGGLKQIDSVGPSGETVLDYSVYDALAAGFGKLVFVIRRDFEAVFLERVGRRFESKTDVHYVFQELDRLPGDRAVPPGRQKPWGTGHAVWCAAGVVAEPFGVINADDYYGADSFRRLGRFLSSVDRTAKPAHCCMVGFKLDHTLSVFGAVSRGICSLDAQGNLLTVKEATGIEADQVAGRAPTGGAVSYRGDEIVSMNCWGLTPAVFPSLEKQFSDLLDWQGGELKSEFYIPSVVTDLINTREATVAVLPTESTWFGVTYREDRPRVVASLRALVQAGVYPARLWN